MALGFHLQRKKRLSAFRFQLKKMIMLTIGEALEKIGRYAGSFGIEKIALEDSLHRVLAADILADRDYPPFNRSAMDGFAVRADDLQLSRPLRIIRDLHAGDVFDHTLQAGECVRIMTGAPVPDGADAVVRIEESQPGDGVVTFPGVQAKPGQNIAFRGEDVKIHDRMLPKGSLITAAHQAMLAVTGCGEVPVAKLPRMIVYSTGNEVQPLRQQVMPHHIRDSNSYALRGLLQAYRINTAVNNPLPDDPALLSDAFRKGLAYDIMIISGGVSKGVADHVPGVLQELGVKELFHRVRIKPGNPLWAGISGNRKMVFALPGNPVSVQVAFKIFIEPFIRSCLGLPLLQPCYFPMHVSRQPRTGFDEYFPAALQRSKAYTSLHPVAYNGSGDIMATAHSEGIAWHPAGAGELAAQTPVAFYPWHHL